MKTCTAFTILLTTALLSSLAGSALGQSRTGSGALPASLDDYYPPKSPGPAYLLAMHELSQPLSGFVSDLFEGDLANARTNFAAFKREYEKASRMVPEWTAYFSMDAIAAAEAAVASGDQGRIMGALEAVGKTCHDCHVTAMPLAYQRYHWGDFSRIAAADPVTHEDASFQGLMQMLESDLAGIGNDLAQGQREAALAHAVSLAARFGALEETCTACHDTPRDYYVDSRVMEDVSRLQALLASPSASPQAAGELLQRIGMESCRKCHLVHVPAAYAKHSAAAR